MILTIELCEIIPWNSLHFNMVVIIFGVVHYAVSGSDGWKTGPE